jgi:hypothetical protein
MSSQARFIRSMCANRWRRRPWGVSASDDVLTRTSGALQLRRLPGEESRVQSCSVRAWAVGSYRRPKQVSGCRERVSQLQNTILPGGSLRSTSRDLCAERELPGSTIVGARLDFVLRSELRRSQPRSRGVFACLGRLAAPRVEYPRGYETTGRLAKSRSRRHRLSLRDKFRAAESASLTTDRVLNYRPRPSRTGLFDRRREIGAQTTNPPLPRSSARA